MFSSTINSPSQIQVVEPVFTKAVGACVSCRNKKLKCDKLIRVCGNCARIGEECMTIDPISGTRHLRSYVDDLHARVQSLRAQATNRTDNVTTFSPATAHQHDTGSVFSLGQLVVAAVSQASHDSVVRLGTSMAREQKNVEPMKAQHATLPSLGVAIELLDSYFNGLHVTMPFVRRKSVYTQLERLYVTTEQIDAKTKANDIFQINMMFATGAIRLSKRTHQHPKDYYATAMQQENKLLDMPPEIQVQNFLLIFVFATQHDVGIASHWEIIRTAMRVCVEYGLHRARTVENMEAEQMRRRIFWSTYISDRHHSQNLGRPVALDEESISIGLPFNIADEQLEAGEHQELGEYTEVSVLIRHSILRSLGTKARKEFTEMSTASSSFEDRAEAVKRYESALFEWYSSSLVKPTANNAYESKEYLDINFHREKMKLLSYLLLPNEFQNHESRIEFLRRYTQSGSQILKCYQTQLKAGLLVLNWTYIADVLKAGFTLLYCSVQLPRCFMQYGDIASLEKTEIESMATSIRETGTMLAQISAKWQTVRRHAGAFQRLSGPVLKLLEKGAESATGVSRESSSSSSIQPWASTDITQDGGITWDADLFDFTLDMSAMTDVSFSDAEFQELFGMDFMDAS